MSGELLPPQDCSSLPIRQQARMEDEAAGQDGYGLWNAQLTMLLSFTQPSTRYTPPRTMYRYRTICLRWSVAASLSSSALSVDSHADPHYLTRLSDCYTAWQAAADTVHLPGMLQAYSTSLDTSY